ncbi:hypothetical protein F4801DRAFT_582229 [Xylaria longipes]|nr:hypothetical protein F4801DRAFT_582229 [Xylaria longipes]RYC61428.1 hypothetical protein CHU98_g4784 [Xylaria longipes]
MADAVAPQTPPRKLFKPSSKTKTPSRPSPQTSSLQKTASDAPRSVVSESPEPSSQPSVDSVAKSTNLAPLTNVSATSDELAETVGSDTTGLVDNYVLTPADTASRSTDARSPLSRNASQSAKGSSPSFKDKVSRARESAKESADDLARGIADKFTGDSESAASSLSAEVDGAADNLNSPTGIAKYFRDKGMPEMGYFVSSLAGNGSHDSGENTPRPAKSSAGDAQSSNDRANQVTNGQKNERLGAGSQQQSQDRATPNPPEPADVSKTADGTFRDTQDNESTAKPTNKMGEPNVSNISQKAHPTIPSATSDTTKQPHGTPQTNDQDDDAQVFDNMGRPAHVERSIEIPFQRPGKKANSPPDYEKQRRDSNDLGDFEDLPSIRNLPSTDDLPDIPEEDSQDPPEEVLDPSVHSTSASITPIPKIPKIPHIDSSAPADLARLAQGLAGHAVDDVGNIVDESGEVLGHATGDLPAMVGKKVSDDGEVYGDGGEIVGYVSQNFVNPPSPTEIPGDLLGRLRVDHQGNILDSDGKIIGKFHEPPKSSARSSSPKVESEEKSKEGQKPKVNAQTGGSPSDLFLDVKSTTDGIQLTIRIPTTFSRQPSESQS